MKNLSNIIESILFVAGKEISIKDIADKLKVTEKEILQEVATLKEHYSGENGIILMQFNDKLQLASNSCYVDAVSTVLNPIREKELTKAMLETLAIVAYKQPVTKLEVEEVRTVDCAYALQNLAKLSMIKILGRKDAIGKPLLFGTTDEFLKRFSLSSISQLPDYEALLERIQTISNGFVPKTDLYNSNRDVDYKNEESIPDFLIGEKFDIID
ncbi:MAG: SMC-Scp complex subunit ScpB [Clostridia bacterium]